MKLKRKIVRSFLRILPRSVSLRLAKNNIRFAQNLPPGIVTTQPYCGYTVDLDTQYPVERTMISGHYDPASTRVLKDFVKKGDTVMDVGANVGALSLILANLVGESGSVIALEPGPLTHDRFRETIARNSIPNISLLQVGLSKNVGKLYWKLDRGNLGNAFLVEKGGDVEVEVVTLDALIQSEGITKLSFIKIDVEGMELQVFQGAGKALAELKPTLLFETLAQRRANRRKEGSSYYDDLEALMKSLGYVLFAIEDSGYRRTIMEETSSDTLAVHKDNKEHLAVAEGRSA